MLDTHVIAGITFTLLDAIALLWFITAWGLYSIFTDYSKGRERTNLVTVMYRHRLDWMEEMVKRDNRMVDAKVASNLMGSVSFFASTSILILAGLTTLLGNTEKAIIALSSLPFTTETTVQMWDIKIILLMLIFTYSFFKHTWALRQYNYTSILIAAAPVCKTPTEETQKHTIRAAKILALAAKNFTMGLRGYYFGMAALTWFLHPAMFILCTLWVVLVLFRREMHSKTLRILSE